MPKHQLHLQLDSKLSPPSCAYRQYLPEHELYNGINGDPERKTATIHTIQHDQSAFIAYPKTEGKMKSYVITKNNVDYFINYASDYNKALDPEETVFNFGVPRSQSGVPLGPLSQKE